MDITERDIEQGTVIELSGRFDNISAAEVQKKLLNLLQEGKHTLFLDFKNVSYLSSSGMRTLILTTKRAKEVGGFVCIVSVPANIEEVLEMTGALSFIRIYKDLETARLMDKGSVK